MKRIIVGISGASGAVYGIRMIEALRGRAESHLVISTAARRIISMETSRELAQIESMATAVHDFNNLAAPISSGSFRTDGMVIVPCSVKSLSAVANSYGENLIARAADVMVRASEMGAIIFPPLPAFYNRPDTLEEVLDHTVGRILDLFEIEHTLFRRWGEGKG
jgi:4-hydroxy-3-polyprenylbenzoate decarboxylase